MFVRNSPKRIVAEIFKSGNRRMLKQNIQNSGACLKGSSEFPILGFGRYIVPIGRYILEVGDILPQSADISSKLADILHTQPPIRSKIKRYNSDFPVHTN